MDTLAAIGRWLSKQHVVTWCVSREDELWCANAFYVYDPDTVAFYLLSEEHTRHGQMTGQRYCSALIEPLQMGKLFMS